jgi:NADPH2:quinone reductase
MRAVLCREYGPPESLVLAEVPDPVAGPGQVLLEVHAAAVNFPDVLIIENKYQFKPPLPFSPGGECAGVVRAVGEGVRHLKPGDRVIALTGHGAFAELVCVDARNALPMPTGLDFVTGSALILTYGTTEHALVDRGRLAAGETLLVLGAAGGVGLAAIEIGKALGTRVIAAASSADKLAACREHGADATIDYQREDLRERIKELTGGKGVDVVYDPVGGAWTEAAMRSLAWRGRLLVIGFASGEIPKLPLNLALLKGASIVGVFYGDYVRREPAAAAKALAQLFEWQAAGRIRPHVSARFPLAEAGRAIRELADRRAIGKLVVEVRSG